MATKNTSGREYAERRWRELFRRDKEVKTTPEPAKTWMRAGTRDDNQEALWFKPKSLSHAAHVVGWSGFGKTNYLKHLIGQLVERKRKLGYGFAVIDPHGDLAEYALDLLTLSGGDLAGDTYYVDFRQDQVLSLNPLQRWWPDGLADYNQRDHELYAGSQFMEATTKAYGARSSFDQPTIADVFTNIGQALCALGLSPLESRYFTHRGERDLEVFWHLVRRLPEGSDIRSAWEHDGALPPREIEGKLVGPRNRLRHLIGPDRLKLLLGQAAAPLNFLDLMNQGRIGIFNLSITGDAGIPADGQLLFASLLLGMFQQSFIRRKENDPEASPPFTLLLDEFGEYCSPEAARTLTAARKYNLETVFAHQELSQLVPPDGDPQLMNAVLGVPNKLIFGGLPIDQCELLTKQVWVQMLDPDKVQHQHYTVSFWPIPVKDYVRSVTRSKSHSEAIASALSESRGTHSGSGSIAAPGGMLGGDEALRLSTSLGISEAFAQTVSRAFASQQGWSETLQEAWRTEYQPFLQPDAPKFEDLDVQVFRYAQAMNCRPTGRFVFKQMGDVPYYAHVDEIKQKALSAEERAGFLGKVYRKPEYQPVADVRQILKRRHEELLARSRKQIVSSSSSSKRPRKRP